MTGAIGVAVFAAIAGAALALELTARRRWHGHVPLPAVMRWLRRHPVMRWALLVAWGFVGWHFFVR